MRAETRRALLRYGIAIDVVVMATAVGLLFPDRTLVLVAAFLAAVAFAAWKARWSGALTAAVLSLVILALLFHVSAATLVAFSAVSLICIAAATQRRSRSESTPPRPTLLRCFTCKVDFDSAEADWCNCLTNQRTLVCTNCLSCFCKAPPAYAEECWSEILAHRPAPPVVLAANPATGDVKRPLVLSVEDDAVIQQIIQRVCTNLGYGFIHAGNGNEGLALARAYRPNLILADAFAPQLDGREMCRVLRQDTVDGRDAVDAECRMVVTTGLYVDTKYRADALARFRVNDFITKPVSGTELINLFETHLEGVTGLPPQEDLHTLHRKETYALPGPSYILTCSKCGQLLDAVRAESCMHCGTPLAHGERFWLDAPASLFERKMIAESRGSRPALDTRHPLVLIAVDDENVAFLVRTTAALMGFGVLSAASAPDALALAREHKPQLILSDALLGREWFRPLRKRARILVMSGRDLPGDALQKPIAVDDLLPLLRATR